jgi:hypothetical protein
MSSRRPRLSRRELGLVAAALLVPLPLFALTGFSAPLPNAIDRGLGGLVAIEAQDRAAGASVGVVARPGHEPARAVKRATAIRAPHLGSPLRTRARSTTSSAGTGSTDTSGTGGDAKPQQDSPDENGGGTGSPEKSGEPGPSEGSNASKPAGHPAPSAQIGVTGQGAGVNGALDSSGLNLDVGADGGDAGSGEPGSARAIVTGSDGSPTGVEVAVPGLGAAAP